MNFSAEYKNRTETQKNRYDAKRLRKSHFLEKKFLSCIKVAENSEGARVSLIIAQV